MRLVTELYGGGPGARPRARRPRRPTLARPAGRRRAGRPACWSCTASTPTTSRARVAARARLGAAVPRAATAATSSCSDIDEDAGAVHLRLLGSCDGCPSSAVTLQHGGRAGDRRGRAGDRDHRRRGADRARIAPAVTPPSTLGRKPVRRPSDRAPPAGTRRARRAIRSRVLAADPAARRPTRRPRPGERCDLCAEPIPDEHEHVVDLEQRSLMCTCRGCYLLFTPDGAGGRPLPRRARPLPVVPRLRALAGAVGRLQIPVSVAFFFVNSTPRAGRRLLPEPGRRHRVAAAARHVGRARGGQPGPGDARCPTSRRFLVRVERRARRGRVLPRAHRRLLRAGRPAAPAVAGLRRRPGGPRRARRVLRPDPCARRAGPPGSASRELALVRGARRPGRAARRGADADAAPADHRGRRRSRSTPSPCAARS